MQYRSADRYFRYIAKKMKEAWVSGQKTAPFMEEKFSESLFKFP
jgi:hypothetical protein